MDSTFNVEDKSHASDVLERFNRFRQNQQYCDYTIKCGSRVIPVHKCFIAASSEHLNGMLSQDTTESENGIVELKEVDPESVARCVDFMYAGKAALPKYKQFETIHAASFLQLHKLRDMAADCVAENIEIHSFFTVRKIAKKYGCRSLLEACDEFAVENLCYIIKKDEFRDLDAEFWKPLLSSPDLNLLADAKCKALMIWANHDTNRASCLFDLMELIDMKKVRISYRKYLINIPVIFNSPQCLEYIKSTIPDASTVQAADYPGQFEPSIMLFNKVSNKIVAYSLERKAWSELRALDRTIQWSVGIVVVDELLYLITRDPADPALFCLAYKEKDANWKQLSTPTQNFIGPVVVLNRALYLIDCQQSYRVGRYDLVNDCWSQLDTNYPICHESVITAAYGKLIVIGGDIGPPDFNEDDESLSDIDASVGYFDPNTSTWSYLNRLCEDRTDPAACFHKNAIYVFGGCSYSTPEYVHSMEILRSLESQWELVKLSNLSRCKFMSHSFNGKIYLVGGNENCDYQPYQQRALVFDPKFHSVLQLTSMPAADFGEISYHSAMVIL